MAPAGGSKLPFPQTFAASAIAACTAEVIARHSRGWGVLTGAGFPTMRCPHPTHAAARSAPPADPHPAPGHRQGQAAAAGPVVCPQVQVGPAPERRRALEGPGPRPAPPGGQRRPAHRPVRPHQEGGGGRHGGRAGHAGGQGGVGPAVWRDRHHRGLAHRPGQGADAVGGAAAAGGAQALPLRHGRLRHDREVRRGGGGCGGGAAAGRAAGAAALSLCAPASRSGW
jgi:hypothetical protein